MASIWKPGRRLVTVAAILMLLMALLHTIGQFAPPDAGELTVINVMRGYRIDLGLGMRPSFFDIFRTLSFAMSVTFAGLGLLNLVVVADAEVGAGLLRRITWVNLLWVVGLSVVSLVYQVPPPLTFGLVMAGVLVASLILNRKR